MRLRRILHPSLSQLPPEERAASWRDTLLTFIGRSPTLTPMYSEQEEAYLRSRMKTPPPLFPDRQKVQLAADFTFGVSIIGMSLYIALMGKPITSVLGVGFIVLVVCSWRLCNASMAALFEITTQHLHRILYWQAAQEINRERTRLASLSRRGPKRALPPDKEQEAYEAYQREKEYKTPDAIAEQFGISGATLNRIVKRRCRET